MNTPNKVYTKEQIEIINSLEAEAKSQFNTTFTERRRAAEERAEAKRELESMGLGL